MNINLDLRPPELKQKEQFNWKRIIVLALLITYVLGLLILYQVTYQDYLEKRSQLESQDELKQELREDVGEYRDLSEIQQMIENKREHINTLQEERILWTNYFSELTKVIPDNTYLLEFAASDPKNIQFRGRSESVDEIMYFKQQLKHHTAYYDLTFNGLEKRDDLYQFDMTAKVPLGAEVNSDEDN